MLSSDTMKIQNKDLHLRKVTEENSQKTNLRVAPSPDSLIIFNAHLQG